MYNEDIEKFLKNSMFTDNQKKQIATLCVNMTQMIEPTTITQRSGLFPVGFRWEPTFDGMWFSFKKQYPIKTSFGLEHDTYEFLMIPPSLKRKIEVIFKQPKPTKNIAHIRFTNDSCKDIEYISINNSRLDSNGCMVGFNTSSTKTIWYNTTQILSISLSTNIIDKATTGQGVDE